MSLPAFLKLYALTLPVFLAIDLVWLGIVARGFYRSQLGDLLRPDVRWGAALLFYAVYVAALLVLAVVPAVERQSLTRAALLGGLFGFAAYAAYDLTNLATLRGFPTLVAAIDLAWGSVLGAGVAAIAYHLARLVR
ncbi:MAG: DUF2177 family protein [Gemmatimonadota bacterium]|nr:DUF2177 family protein [Gemmatimonadota bacterium]